MKVILVIVIMLGIPTIIQSSTSVNKVNDNEMKKLAKICIDCWLCLRETSCREKITKTLPSLAI